MYRQRSGSTTKLNIGGRESLEIQQFVHKIQIQLFPSLTIC